MQPTSVGHFLLNRTLPEKYHVKGPMTSKEVHNLVVGLAKEDPAQYVKSISELKRRGDEIATLEGISVGLDDIEPDYAARNAVVEPLAKAVAEEKDPVKRERLVIDAQSKLLDLTKKHPGSMTRMALSGARGNVAQLMKIVTTPLAANDAKRGINPFIIRRSYAEGLTPAEYWTTTPEARALNVATVVSVSKPGEMAKVLVSNLIGHAVSAPDCGTHNGVRLPVDDPNVLGRHLARDQHGHARNALVDPRLVQDLKVRGAHDLLVRSPMTCVAQHGVCQMCQGLDERGKLHAIGTNVGVRAAQALSEPITQMTLGSKHAVLTIRERKLEPQGIKGLRQLLEIPALFQHEAVLAPAHGTVGRIEKAPQGGHYVWVGAERLYAAPELTVTAKPGQTVEAGDALTNGVPHPAKLVAAKGIGAGRQYFVDALHKVYKDEGKPLDRRHIETLARSTINHVRIDEVDDDHPEFLKGDVIDYNRFRDVYSKSATRLPVREAVGKRLGEDVLHHTVGTEVTPSLATELEAKGVREVPVAKGLPRVSFVMKSFVMNPLEEEDWMARLAHRYLKGSIQRAAHIGEESDIHGPNPVPAYAYGAEFRHGPKGTY